MSIITNVKVLMDSGPLHKKNLCSPLPKTFPRKMASYMCMYEMLLLLLFFAVLYTILINAIVPRVEFWAKIPTQKFKTAS